MILFKFNVNIRAILIYSISITYIIYLMVETFEIEKKNVCLKCVYMILLKF